MDKPVNLENVDVNDPYKIYCKQYICDFFGKISQREIARRLKIGKTTVNKWSKSLGFSFKKHTVNENYFKTVSPEMFYILGFISADGSVSWDTIKGYYSLTITAAKKDGDHLEKIRSLLKSSKPLLYSETTESYRLIINNKQICRDLMKFGIIPRKSLVMKFPDLPDKYLKDFIRGYIDGDGSLQYFKRPRSPYFSLMICSGSIDFMESLEEIIFQKLEIKARITKTKNNCFVMRYFCQRGLKLAYWIYEDSSLYLSRKFNIYQEALSFRKELVP